MPRPLRLLSLGLCASASLAIAAPAAHAVEPLYVPTGNECRLAPLVPGLVAGKALVDRLGYVYDTSDASLAYGALDEGESDESILGLFTSDAYDRFGALFVGSGQFESTRYRDPADDANGCATEAAGRQLALRPVDLGFLQVQRRVFVSGTTGSGVRLLDSVRNPTGAPVTTDVYVGDLRAAPSGTLGSDWSTTVNTTSDGNTTLSPSDRWAVTTDGRTLLSDPAVAHVWGGPGADDDVDLVRSGAVPNTKAIDAATNLEVDQFGWGWTDVTVEPGETRSYLSWETFRGSADTKASTQAGLAATAAADLMTAPLSRVYEGLTAAQIGSVANWAKPAASATVLAGATKKNLDVTFTATNVDFGSSKVGACTTGTLAWDFGDGARAVGNPVTHRFTAEGPTEVSLIVSGTCGGTSVSRKTVNVFAPTVEEPVEPELPVEPTTPTTPTDSISTTPVEPPSSAPADPVTATPKAAEPAPAGASAPSGPAAIRGATKVAPAAAKLTLDVAPKLTASDLGKRGVRPTVTATAPGTVRLVLSGGGLKIVKTKQVTPGVVTPAAMKLGRGDAARVRGLKLLQLRAKLTLENGNEVVVSRVISVGR